MESWIFSSITLFNRTAFIYLNVQCKKKKYIYSFLILPAKVSQFCLTQSTMHKSILQNAHNFLHGESGKMRAKSRLAINMGTAGYRTFKSVLAIFNKHFKTYNVMCTYNVVWYLRCHTVWFRVSALDSSSCVKSCWSLWCEVSLCLRIHDKLWAVKHWNRA